MRAARRGGEWDDDRRFLHVTWAVLFRLGIVEATPANRCHRDPTDRGPPHRRGARLASRRLGDYTAVLADTHAPSMRDGIAIRLTHFGRHLAGVDPNPGPRSNLDRQRHIELCLAGNRSRPGSNRNRVTMPPTVRRPRPSAVGKRALPSHPRYCRFTPHVATPALA